MSLGYAEFVAHTLPLTVGDGKPVYRTDPSTGQRFTYEKLQEMVKQTSTSYNFVTNFYIGDPAHEYDTQA